MQKLLDAAQVILLDNLMYLSGDRGPFTPVIGSLGMTAGAYAGQQLHALGEGPLPADQDRLRDVLRAIRWDPELSALVIADARIESAENGRGSSAMFIALTTREAVICFRGTNREEWRDNFFGGGMTDAADRVSTAYQLAALAAYHHYVRQVGPGFVITVSGHSKGGNKAKYITILDGSVTRCISCDGQGFSDEFFRVYQRQITERKHKIINHNIDDDFVNLLLNDVGKKTFFYKNNRGKTNPVVNHLPDAFFRFDGQGGYSVTLSRRPEEVAQMDCFLNSLLRSMSPDRRVHMLAMFGDFAALAFSSSLRPEDVVTLVISEANREHIAYIVSFILRYGRLRNDFSDQLAGYLRRNSLGGAQRLFTGIRSVTASAWMHWLTMHDRVYNRLVNMVWTLTGSPLRKRMRRRMGQEFVLSKKQVLCLADRLMDGLRGAEGISELPDGSDLDNSDADGPDDELYIMHGRTTDSK